MANDIPEFDPSKPFEPVKSAIPEFDPSQPHEVKRTNTTIADYPEIYGEMNRESREQIAHGVKQLSGQAGSGYWTGVKGWGNIGLGALGYVGSPIAAGIRTVVGEPLQQRAGIPKEYSEFATSLAIPGIGLPRIPGTTTPNVLTKVTGPRTGKVADEARLLTKGGQETQAGLALREAATDPAKAERALGQVDEIIPGSQPTTFQASGDKGLGQLERGVQTKNQTPFQEVRENQGVARVKALESAERPGSPEEVANHLRDSMRAEDAAAEAAEKQAIAQAEQRIQQATQRAEQADQAAGGTGFTPDISGQVFQRELSEANIASRNAASRQWEAIDPQGRLSVNADPVINADFRLRNNMTLADAETVTDAERRIAGVIEQYTPVVPFREMRSLRSLISTSMREEMRARGPSPAYGRMAELRGAVEQSAVAPFEVGAGAGPGQAAASADAADRLAAATAATRERSAIFKSEPVQGIVKPGQGGELRMTPSAVPGKIIPAGPKGYDTVNAYLRATVDRPGGGLQEVSEALVADLRAHATDVNGVINPDKLMGWARGRQAALRAVAERDGGALVRRLMAVQQAGLEAKLAEKNLGTVIKEAATKRAAVSKQGTEGIFGDLMGVRDKEDISKLLGSVFGSKTAVADAEAIMARLTTPEAQDGARRAITDWITSKLVSNTAAGTSEVNILRADQFQQFIKQNVAVLERFGFTPEQIKTWQAIAADMRRAKMSIDATKVPGGSNTAQDLYAMKKFGLQGSKLSKILHLAGGLVGGFTSGPLGAIAGLLGAGKYAAIREAGITSVQDLIVKGMTEPEFGRELLKRVTPKENIAFWRTAGMYGKRAARAEALTGSRHDQSEPAPKGHAYGGTVFPLGSEGIQARNKARAFEARERSSFTRGSAQAKREIGYAEGGLTRGSEGDVGDAAALFANNPTIDAIERMHQNRKLAQGAYDTQLTPDEELKYRQWKAQNAPQDSGADYDLRGAYKAGVTRDAASGHMPDTFKKPNHPTFSDQSRYAPAAPQRAGRWEGETYIPRQFAEGGEVIAPYQVARMPITNRSGVSGNEVRELEGVRKQKTQHLSQADSGVVALASGGSVNADSGKVTKESVNYGKGMPKAHCSICTHWQHGKCSEVQGKIWHSMWCELFKKAKKYAGGGAVTEDDTITEEDPLEAEKKRREVPGGLSATAGPTVTSTTPVQDIPAPKVNSQGETLPTYALKEMGKSLISLPERATKEAGDLQRRGELAGSHEDLPSFGGSGGMPAATEATMMLYGANAPFAKPGLGIFGGKGAKTANLPKLAEAEEMLKQGVPHETIRNRTGWEFGPDGKPRFEISDAEARIKPEHPEDRIYEADAASRATGFRPNQRLEQQMEHPAAYEAYPWLKDMRTSLDVSERNAPGASFAPPTKNQKRFGKTGEIEVRAPTYERGGVGDLFGEQKYSDTGARDMMLHEMQHAIQEREGFSPGANPQQLPLSKSEVTGITQRLAEKEGVDWSKLGPKEREQMERVIRYRMYKAHAGETEARNVQTRADYELRQRPSWATEDVKREHQLLPKTGKLKKGEKPFNDAKVYKYEPEPKGVSKPGLMRSEFDRPLFDYSNMAEVPNVPQFDLPRIIPARGIPEHILRLGDPRNMERTNQIVQMGMAHGGPEWYNTMPLRDRYIGEVGATKGPESHRSFLNYTGATSPRTPVPTNVGAASYYDMRAAQGLPLPKAVYRIDPETGKGNWHLPPGQLPEGYGSLSQATNANNAALIHEQGGWPSWTFFDKPKPPSFTSNLMGNYRPITSDVHNVNMLNLRRPDLPSGEIGKRLDMPPHPYYGYIEGLQQGPRGAGAFGIEPAQYQAAGWIPWAAGYREVGRHGEVTGGSPKQLAAYSQPFIRVVEDRVKNKARELGWSPEQTLRSFLRKEIAITGVPAAAIPMLRSQMGEDARQ